MSVTLAPAARPVSPATYRAHDLSTLLGVSQRTIWRMADAGLIPGKIRLSASVRWNRAVIDAWISNGCPKPKNAKV